MRGPGGPGIRITVTTGMHYTETRLSAAAVLPVTMRHYSPCNAFPLPFGSSVSYPSCIRFHRAWVHHQSHSLEQLQPLPWRCGCHWQLRRPVCASYFSGCVVRVFQSLNRDCVGLSTKSRARESLLAGRAILLQQWGVSVGSASPVRRIMLP